MRIDNRLRDISAKMLTAWSVIGECSGLRIQMASAFHQLTNCMNTPPYCVTRKGLTSGRVTPHGVICVIEGGDIGTRERFKSKRTAMGKR
jgi:hypothetical protein